MKSTQSMTAMVLTQSRAERETYMGVFSKFGFHAVSASNSVEFLQKFKEKRPDVCLIDFDIEKPGCGLLLLKAIRKIFGHEVRVLFLSDPVSNETLLESIRCGVDDWLIKPINRIHLANSLVRYFTTDALDDARSKAFTVPDAVSDLNIVTDWEIIRVDEHGVTLAGKHLISRGTALHLDSSFFGKISNPGQSVLITIQETWWDREQNQHYCYASYDDASMDFRKNLRTWLAEQSA